MCTHSRRPMHVMDVIHSVVSQKSCWHSVTNGLLFTVCPSLFYLTETRNSWESCVPWRTSSNPHDPCPPTRKRVMWSTTQNTNVWAKNKISTQIKSYMDRSDPRNSVRIQRLGWHRVIVRHLTVPTRLWVVTVPFRQRRRLPTKGNSVSPSHERKQVPCHTIM